MSDVGFRSYTYNGVRVVPGSELARKMDSQAYFIHSDNISFYKRPKEDTRSKARKFYDEVKRRVGNAWYMLCGGEFE